MTLHPSISAFRFPLSALALLLCALGVSGANSAPRQKSKPQSPPPLPKASAVRRSSVGMNTNRVPVLVSSVLIGGVRQNVFRWMWETNALKITDVIVESLCPPMPKPLVKLSFETPWRALVQTAASDEPVERTYTATVTLSDTNDVTSSLYYRFERPAYNSTITIEWGASPSENVAGYHLYVGNYPGTWTDIYTLPGTSTNWVTRAASGGTYYFSLSAFDATNTESEHTNEVRVTVPTYEVLPTVTLQ